MVSSPLGQGRNSVALLSDAGNSEFLFKWSSSPTQSHVGAVAGVWVVSSQWDLLPLVAALTALRISPYKVGPIKALSFPHQGPLESKAFQCQQFELSN